MADNLVQVGTICKSHGISGELEVKTSNQLLLAIEPQFIFILLDDCFVPFQLIEVWPKNHGGCYIHLKDVENDQDVKALLQKNVFIDKHLVDQADLDTLGDVVSVLGGFEVFDVSGNYVGKIQCIDTSTINILIELDNGAVLPLHEDIILGMDVPARRIQLDVNDELLQLN
ncbi:MAG: hypothetical protein IJ816_00115 [Alloprevotella sp.]|nr:hypothetical protein [Alloprevotella sp.]